MKNNNIIMAKSKEELQKEANKQRNLRNKQIAQLKAQNELLDSAKKEIIRHYGENNENTDNLFGMIETAKNENLQTAQHFLGASSQELQNAVYNEPAPGEIDKYNKMLEKRKITHEQLAEKDITKNSVQVISQQKEESVMDKLKNKLKNLKDNKNTKTIVTAQVEIDNNDGVLNDEDFKKIMKEKYNNKEDDNIQEIEEKIINIVENKPSSITTSVVETPIADRTMEVESRCLEFDVKDIPSDIAFDVIKLPSKGECYSHKKSALPVAYLTAADENLIASPNLYSNGSLLDIILERKILDKTINVKDLCQGDRDAIIIWLRATAYDNNFPVQATNKETGKSYTVNVDLSALKYKPFDLIGDENGYFDYTTGNGDLIKFKMLSHSDLGLILKKSFAQYNVINKSKINEYIKGLTECVLNLENSEGIQVAMEAMNIIKEWGDTLTDDKEVNTEIVFNDAVTNRMIYYTKSINGETNPIFVKNYINNMRAGEAMKYRKYVEEHQPGMDLKIDVQIPESDGGGSFSTFLGIQDTIFLTL